jgi:hypothetical protein
MSTGASDGVFTKAEGILTYAVSGIAIEFGDDRAHGRDERIAVKSFYGASISFTATSKLSPRRTDISHMSLS